MKPEEILEIVTGKTTSGILRHVVTRFDVHPWLTDPRSYSHMIRGQVVIPHTIECNDCREALLKKHLFRCVTGEKEIYEPVLGQEGLYR